MTGTEQTDEDGRPPGTVGAKGLCQQSEHGEAGEDQHGTHTTQIGIHATLLDKVFRQVATTDREHGDDEVEGEDQQNAHCGV